jgi:hypothetical protein
MFKLYSGLKLYIDDRDVSCGYAVFCSDMVHVLLGEISITENSWNQIMPITNQYTKFNKNDNPVLFRLLYIEFEHGCYQMYIHTWYNPHANAYIMNQAMLFSSYLFAK